MKWSTSARVDLYLLERQTRACSYISIHQAIDLSIYRSCRDRGGRWVWKTSCVVTHEKLNLKERILTAPAFSIVYMSIYQSTDLSIYRSCRDRGDRSVWKASCVVTHEKLRNLPPQCIPWSSDHPALRRWNAPLCAQPVSWMFRET